MEQEDFEKGKQNRKYFLITNKSQSKSLHFSKHGKLPVIIQQHQEGDYDQNPNSSQKYIDYSLTQKKLNIFQNATGLYSTLFGEKFSFDSKPYYQVGYNELRKIHKKLTRKKTFRKMTRAQSLASNLSNRSSNHPSNTTNKEQIIVMDDIINEILITHQPKIVDKKVSRLLKSQSSLKLYEQRWSEEKSKYPRILNDCDNYRKKVQERNIYQQKALKQNVNSIGRQWQVTLRNNKTMQNLLVLPGMNCMKDGLKIGSKSKYNSEIKWGEKYSTYAFTKLPQIQNQNVQTLYKKNIGNVTIIRN